MDESSQPHATRKHRVVIVGAGIGGLAAAWELSRASSPPEVILLEANSRAGGVLETIYDSPYLIERSADNFATLIPDALQLSNEVGYSGELIQPQQHGRQAFVVRRGRIHPIPIGFSLVQPTRVWPILTTPTLSIAGKLRMLGEYFVPARTDDTDESLQSFAIRRLGQEAFDQLVEPIVSGIFTADPQRLSVQATLPQFVAMEKKHGGLIRGHLAARRENAAAVARRASGARYDQFMAPRKGMSHWIDHIVASLPAGTLQLRSTVSSIRSVPTTRSIPSEQGSPTSESRSAWEINLIQDGQAKVIDCDAIVLATPVQHTDRLLRTLSAPASEILQQIPYASSAVAVLILDRTEIRGRIDGFGLIVPRNENRPVLAISYTSNKYPGRVPDDQIMLRVFLGGALAPETMDQTDSQILACAEQQVRELLGWSGKGTRWQGLVRWKEAMPQYHVGHVERMKQLDQHIGQLGAIRLCGAGYQGVGIPQTVRSARRAAKEILSLLEAATSDRP